GYGSRGPSNVSSAVKQSCSCVMRKRLLRNAVRRREKFASDLKMSWITCIADSSKKILVGLFQRRSFRTTSKRIRSPRFRQLVTTNKGRRNSIFFELKWQCCRIRPVGQAFFRKRTPFGKKAAPSDGADFTRALFWSAT